MRLRILCTVLVLLFAASSIEAQTLQDEIVRLFTFGECGDPVCLNLGGDLEHGDHFISGIRAGQLDMIGFLTNSIGRTIANFPISSASSGVTSRLVAGERVETSRSSGPIFAERSQTLGRGSLLLGTNVSGFSFKTLRGERLNDLTFKFAHVNTQDPALGVPAFENDLIEVTLDMNVTSLVASFFLTYGLGNRLDVSVAVPVVRAEVTGSSVARVIPFGGGSSATPHKFSPTDLTTVTSSANASTSGIGDIALRAKLNITQTDQSGFALLADVRLPTGEEENFLGSGELAVRGLAIYSAQIADFAPHVNAGFVGRGGDLLNDAFVATLGFDQLLVPWFTLAADFISEWQVGENKLLLPEPVVYDQPERRTVDLAPFTDLRDNLIDFALGAKLTPTDGLTVIANLLLPVNQSRGLRPDAAWTAGIEYRFGR